MSGHVRGNRLFLRAVMQYSICRSWVECKYIWWILTLRIRPNSIYVLMAAYFSGRFSNFKIPLFLRSCIIPCVFFNGGIMFLWLIISRMSPPNSTQPWCRLRIASSHLERQALPSFSGNLGALKFPLVPEGSPCPAHPGPSIAIICYLDLYTSVTHAFKTISCRRVTDVWAGGLEGVIRDISYRAGNPAPAPSSAGRQKLTGFTEMTYCNMTIWMAKLQQLIFILITDTGILICWHPELLLCH